ncbi:MDR family MFS transporter [Flavobacterium macacae]|uniref:MFS transporter n=1 Tax=Flavobacterium macacae TaxID=2488993 RepID=A0A3P3W594_9FLAO|nr:MFS transporter [Flavobacterium macacae]RRJ89146.1 MFS transporter [Flavobacterium macacae]
MLQKAFQRYIDSFRGFSKEIWILTLVTFINRAGTMVLPFLSKYLKEDLHFSYGQVGWVMVCFGLGSMIGSWLGGKLSDKVGFYKIMIFSLFTSGIFIFCIQFITSFIGLCLGMFVVMIVADMFRPAMYVSLGAYAKPENRTRAFTLVRLAVNLGFAAGPALGGLIIMGMGYKGLFWIDGLSCVTAILLFALLVKEKKKLPYEENKNSEEVVVKSVFKDAPFWVFLLGSYLTAMVFFQLFTTMPLYQSEWYHISEFQIGLLMSFNGLIIFFLEMPMVNYFERKNVNKLKIIILGTFLLSLSYFVLLINVWVGILVISMFLITIGEMLNFPFSNTFAMSRAPKGHEGRYMALYTMSFSLAHITSAKLGLEIIARFGYQTNWMVMGSMGLAACFSFITLNRMLLRYK